MMNHSVFSRYDQSRVAVCLQPSSQSSPCACVSSQLHRVFRPSEQMIGQDCNPYVGTASSFQLMVEWTQTQFALQASERILDTSECDVQFPQLPVLEIDRAAQVVAAVQLSAVRFSLEATLRRARSFREAVPSK